MMILDASGSMNDKDRYGLVKMDAAKDIIKDISTKLDSSKTNAGLVTFANGCYSSKLLVEPSNNDFNAETTWGNGSVSNSQFTRISKEEMDCMDAKGRFISNTCRY